ncbi:MAG: hypothetical protein M1834_005470 [Cirrosporium novae-zelandiae]|nr:MAG: hypothetical protein M1834_005470 [Cirrosporium novae-zelandiae]
MSESPTIEQLQELLQKEQESRRKAEESQRQAEESRRQAESKIQRTTFGEFLETCHVVLSNPLIVQDNRTFATKGTTTNPKGKYCPTHLRHWDDFPQAQQQLFDNVHELFHPSSEKPQRLFSPKLALEDLGQSLCRRPLASEGDLQSYERFAVEGKVTDVVSNLINIPHANEKFSLGKGVVFENHANTLNDDVEKERFGKRSRLDQVCVYHKNDGNRSLAFVIEYKAAHKLSVAYFRAGLRPMNLWEEVVQRVTVPTDPDEKLKYNAERLVGAAVTQTFSYMIDEGIEYSYLTNGLARVFLRIRRDDPTTLYYYLAEPNFDATIEDEHGFRYAHTALGRVLGLCLMSLNSKVRSQTWRSEAKQQLHRWEYDFEYVLKQMPISERKQTPPGSVYREPSSPFIIRSAYLLRRRQNCAPPNIISRDSHSSSEESSGDQGPVDTPSRPEGGQKRKRVPNSNLYSSPTGDRSRRHSGHSPQQYCTQKCLLNLKTRGLLDENCPNVMFHRQKVCDNQHAIDLPELVRLTKQQLGADLDHYCDPLGKSGARGALFKITLISHGYMFVGKGTRDRFLYDAHREVGAYRRLEKIQGLAVPVCLGGIDLITCYSLAAGVEITYMLLMAWGGEMVDDVPGLSRPIKHKELERSIHDVRRLGVKHEDLRGPNMLWNPELGRVLLIDFYGPSLVDMDGRRILVEISPNKKRKRVRDELDHVKRKRLVLT